MTPDEEEIIDRIFQVRVVNNIPWKKLMKIAMSHAPKETKEALAEINGNDRCISTLLGDLTK